VTNVEDIKVICLAFALPCLACLPHKTQKNKMNQEQKGTLIIRRKKKVKCYQATQLNIVAVK
jgi:hypothetical protein